MMDNFFWPQEPANVILHHKPMFKHRLLLSRIRMLRAVHDHIAVGINAFAAFPFRMLVARARPSPLRFQAEFSTAPFNRYRMHTEDVGNLSLLQALDLNHVSKAILVNIHACYHWLLLIVMVVSYILPTMRKCRQMFCTTFRFQTGIVTSLAGS